MRRSKTLLPRVMILLVLSLPSSSQEPHVLRIQIRETDSGGPLPHRPKSDFRITVNGRATEIVSLHKKEISLGRKPDLGRLFVLSFNLTQISPALERELAYLASEIFETRDTLFLRTPRNLYRLAITPNKEEVLRQAKELLDKDGRIFEKDRLTAEKRLEDQLTRVIGSIGVDVKSPDTYKKTSRFLNTFPGELSGYQERFLLPDPAAYGLVLEKIPSSESERWWIHFEQPEDTDLFQRIRRTNETLKRYLQGLAIFHQTLAQVLSTQLVHLENLVSLPETSLTMRMVETLLGHEMIYSVVLCNGPQGSESSRAQTSFLNLESFYREVTKACGGLTITPSPAEPGVKELAAHRDEFYELAFADEAGPGERLIRIDPIGGRRALSHVQRLSDRQVRSRLQFQGQEKITVKDVALDKGRLHFELDDFALGDDGQIGILKVRVQMYDHQGREVYHQENTLRASQDRVKISVPLPDNQKGEFQVVITACDLIANRLRTEELRIELREPSSAP